MSFLHIVATQCFIEKISRGGGQNCDLKKHGEAKIDSNNIAYRGVWGSSPRKKFVMLTLELSD